jgi:hypothetical protein
MSNHVRRTFVVGSVFAVVFVAALMAQNATAPPQRNQMDELLAEVRAIRADLDRAAAASTRGQLLGMRLQMQEQRIATLSRQLSDVQDKLRGNAHARATFAPFLKMLDQDDKEQAPGKKEEARMANPIRSQLLALDKADVELRAEEVNLLNQLQTEQSRWLGFNTQIEELERAALDKRGR